MAGVGYQNALHPTPSVGFAYDPYFPRITTMTDGTGTTTYSYVSVGALGALSLQQESGPLPGGAIAYAYDALGRVVTRTVGGAPAESFQYDAIGRLAGHNDALGTFALGYLGQTGQLALRRLTGGSVATAWSYLSNTGDRRLAAIANEHTGERQFNYTTTPEDLITQIKEEKSGSLRQTWNIGYDNEYRLLSADSTSEGKYGYALDPTGNISAFGTTAAAYNNVNELTKVGTQPYVSDADGELVADGARTYAWDADNRLVGITYTAQPGKQTSFAYDGQDRRVAITTTVSGIATTTNYIWCGQRICQSRNGTSAVNRLYYDEGETIPASKALFYYGPDQLGSVRDVYATSPLFSMVQAYDYDPYGNPTVTPATGPLTDFRYAGMLYHADSGLYLTQYRAYDPRTARWLSRDPLAEVNGARMAMDLSRSAHQPSSLMLAVSDHYSPAMSLYTYAINNPLNFTDPRGLDPRDSFLGAVLWIVSNILGIGPATQNGPPADFPVPAPPSPPAPTPTPVSPPTGGPGGGGGAGGGGGGAGGGASCRGGGCGELEQATQEILESIECFINSEFLFFPPLPVSGPAS